MTGRNARSYVSFCSSVCWSIRRKAVGGKNGTDACTALDTPPTSGSPSSCRMSLVVAAIADTQPPDEWRVTPRAIEGRGAPLMTSPITSSIPSDRASRGDSTCGMSAIVSGSGTSSWAGPRRPARARTCGSPPARRRWRTRCRRRRRRRGQPPRSTTGRGSSWAKQGAQYGSSVLPLSMAAPTAGTCEHPTPPSGGSRAAVESLPVAQDLDHRRQVGTHGLLGGPPVTGCHGFDDRSVLGQ